MDKVHKFDVTRILLTNCWKTLTKQLKCTSV